MMSNEYAIAAVTLTLRNLLDQVKALRDSDTADELPADVKPTAEILITNLPLDEAYEFDQAKNQVNLFLYHVEHSAAWRNTDVPGRVKNGETAHPPLALNLYYLITAYGQDKNEIIGHLLLGKAMSILHDHPLLSREEIRIAFAVANLHEQVERVRITPQPISLDEVSKLWTGFQSQYKLSVAYQVSVVLIESKRPSRTPLPVLMRGQGDRGVLVQPFVVAPFPVIESIEYPANQIGAQQNDILTITGRLLRGDNVLVRFRNSRLPAELTVAPDAGGTDKKVTVRLPVDADNWAPGLYTAKVVVNAAGEPEKISNEFPFMLVPVITFPVAIGPLSPGTANNYLAEVTFTPKVRPAQNAYLLLGNREFKSLPHPAITDKLQFELRDVEDGKYYLRLRVDGADSLFIDATVTPPVFRASNEVILP